MRPGLVAYFDIGRSFGLNDAAIRPEFRNPDPDLGMVGIRNPLGAGATTDLLADVPALVERWRTEARVQLVRPVFDTGYDEASADITRAEFDRALEEIVASHPIVICDVTVFGMGVAYVRLELGSGIEPRWVTGVLAAFEFAGYRATIAESLWSLADAAAARAMTPPDSDFTRLTERPPAETHHSTEVGEAYEESSLINSFTGLIRCVDDGDEALLDRVLNVFDMADAITIDYERHGILRYDWATCVLVPHAEPPATPDEQLERIEECIRIAHVFTGTCEALLGLFRAELNRQVASYVTRERGGQGPEELNKLRTIALAVVNLTNFARVAQAEEDRTYFRRFTQDAQLGDTRDLLRDSVEVLYNVQEAAAQHERSRREYFLNAVVIILTSLTIVSVSADSYDFVRDQEAIIEDRVMRIQLFVELMVVLVLLVTVMLWFLLRTPTRRR